MTSDVDGIITRFRERRQIEADLRSMEAARSEIEFREMARQIAARGGEVIPVLIRSLDRTEGHRLEVLGAVAAALDRREVVRALRAALRQPERAVQGRQAALLILERYLNEPVEADLRPSLAEAAQAAISALDGVLGSAGDGSQRRAGALAQEGATSLLGYLQGLDRQEPDVVLAVVRALRAREPAQAVEPLRMLALDVREEIAAEALQALGSIRAPEAARAVQTLIPILPPSLSPVAGRLLRKLRLAGVPVEELPPAAREWRALVGPIDGRGQQNVWFIQESRWAAHARFLNVLLSDRAGAVEAVGHGQMPLSLLPPRRPKGMVHEIPLGDGAGMALMLEGDFDWGRRIVRDALSQNRETQIPVAAVLRLLSPWLWDSASAHPASTGAEPQPWAHAGAIELNSQQLLTGPPFDGWTVLGETARLAAEQALRHPGWDLDVWVRRLAFELFGEPAMARLFHRRLMVMSEWLLVAGDEPRARLARATAEALLGESPGRVPFVEALVRRDLERAVCSVGDSTVPHTGTGYT